MQALGFYSNIERCVLLGLGRKSLMPFQYRLQQVYQLRERKKQEQERRVQRAREAVKQIELAIEAKKSEIRQVRQNMYQASHMLFESHDLYLERLNQQLDELHQDLEIAQQKLEEEIQLLIKAQADLEALVKHKERAYEEYLEEEKQLELKQMNEIAGQRYFRQQQAIQLEE